MLKRKGFEPRPQRDPNEFASFVPPRGAVAVMARPIDATGGQFYVVPAKIDKRVRKRQSLRDSANGETCLMLLPGCLHDAILSHNRHARAGKGGAMKALDVASAYTCVHCDAIYDGQRRLPGFTRDMIELAWYRAHDETLVKFAQKGLL
jgi:hypothetical protein